MKSKYYIGTLSKVEKEDINYRARYVIDNKHQFLWERTGFLYISSLLYFKIVNMSKGTFPFFIRKHQDILNRLIGLELGIENKV